MKTRGIFCVVFLVFLLSLSGIGGCPKKGEEEGYAGGVNGLDISFVDEEPPEEVLDNKQEPFYMTLLVENMGEYIIPKGKIIATLSGIRKDDFGIKSLNVKSRNSLLGVSVIDKEIISGDLEELRFGEANYKPDLLADFTTQLRVDVCYKYQTNSLTKLCLKKNPLQRRTEDLCEITSGSIEVENSGAPLQVSDVKSRAGVDSVTFTFTVVNDGIGGVYEDNAFSDKCILEYEKRDRVNVKVSSPGNIKVECSTLNNKNSGVVRLIDGMKTVICNVKTSGLQETAFEEPFEIVLDYFYKDSVGKGLTILNAEY